MKRLMLKLRAHKDFAQINCISKIEVLFAALLSKSESSFFMYYY